MSALTEKKYLLLWLFIGFGIYFSFLPEFNLSTLLLVIFAAATIIAVVVTSRYSQLYIPTVVEYTAALFVVTSLLIGSAFDFYNKFHWWDGLVHFFSGLFVGAVAYLYMLPVIKVADIKARRTVSAVFALFFSLGVALLWELFEFIVDLIMHTNYMQPSNFDTMTDCVLAFVASVVGIGIMWWYEFHIDDIG